MTEQPDPDDRAGDPLLGAAPLLASWHEHRRRVVAPFVIPGHKGKAGRLSSALGEVLGTDVPLYGGLDTVKLTTGVLAEAERRAAQLWHADFCRFSTGGSTHGNQAVMLALGRPGDRVLVSRTAHRSTLSGLVVSGLVPVWLPNEVDSRYGIPAGVAPATLAAALAEHPDACAVLLVEPGYFGTVSELPELIRLAHEAGRPVVVDQAWAAHFGFHPALPPHALAAGADAMVISAHKTLPAYSQSSIVLARGGRLDPARLERGFEAGHTTSPAGSILASTDGARALLAERGRDLLDGLLDSLDRVRATLEQVPGLRVVRPGDFPPGRYDPAKLVVLLAGTGASGIDVERDLLELGIPLELADADTLVPLATMADRAEDLDRLAAALVASVRARSTRARAPIITAPPRTLPPAPLTPRAAFFAPHETVAIADAVGRVCAELVAPYPPGIPALVPGEEVTAPAVAALVAALAAGTRIAYAADPTLQTLQVVAR